MRPAEMPHADFRFTSMGEFAEAHRKEQERIAAWKKAHPPATQREREDIEKRLQAMGFPPVHTQPAR